MLAATLLPDPGDDVSAPELDHPAIDAVLATAATLLGMEVVFLGGLTEDTFTFEKVHTTVDWPDVVEGGGGERADSFCHRLLAGAPNATSDAENDPAYADAPIRKVLGVTSYVGVPVRDGNGEVLATLCGIDRHNVKVTDEAVSVLRQLAEVIASHVGPLTDQGIVIRRSPKGGWEVGGSPTEDLTSAMVLADLLANELTPATVRRRPTSPSTRSASSGCRSSSSSTPSPPASSSSRPSACSPNARAAAPRGLRAAAQGGPLPRPQGARPGPRGGPVGGRPQRHAAPRAGRQALTVRLVRATP